MLYDGLTRCLPGGAVEPALAERVTISKDQKTYVFHLRRAFWSDGKPITAYDFEKSWKRVLDPPSPCAYLCYPIQNAERCIRGECSIDEVGIKALNWRTLRVELERPTPYFYSLTAFPTFLVARPGENVFSGPFCLKDKLSLEKNESHWNQKNVFLDQIQVSIVPDEMTALHMFEVGDLDWVGGALSPLPPDSLEVLQDQLHFIPSAATTFCTFNTQVFPFHNLHLRKAFAYAIERPELTPLGQIPAESILPPAFSSQMLVSSNAARARLHFEKAMEELKIAATDLESIPLFYKPGQIDKRVALTLQRQWKETLGITLPLVQQEYKTHAQKLQNRDYQIAISSWIAQFDDPISILDRFKDQAHLKNYPGWENEQYQHFLDEANVSENRGELLERAEALFADRVPLTPLYHWSSPALCSPRIKSIASTPCGGILFERFQTNF